MRLVLTKRTTGVRPGWWLLTLLVWLLPAVAAPAAPNPEQARNLVESTAGRMQQVLLANRADLQRDPGRINEYVREIMLPTIDFEKISVGVLGKHFRTATPDQRRRFTEAFREYLVRTYAKALLEYVDSDIEYLPVQPSNREDRAVVRSQVRLDDGTRVQLDYHLYYSEDQWKVWNINIKGGGVNINFIVSNRDQIDSLVASKGLDGAIDQLNQKNVNG